TCTAPVLPFSYQWSLQGKPAGSAAKLDNPTSATPGFTPDLPGAYALALTARDASGIASNTATATVLVSQCSAPLTVVAASGSSCGFKTSCAVSLSVNVADTNTGAACAASAPVAYAWSLVSRPAGSGAGVSDPLSAAPSFTPDQPGTYVAAVRATD